MNHRHLVLAYVATWVIQLSYAGFLIAKWFSLRKAEREFPTYRDFPD
jgi:hypothetical protein